MMLAKVKEQDGMMLAKVKEQDGIVLVKVKVSSITTSVASLNQRGGHSLMKQLTLVKGIGRGFRICCRS